MAVRTNTAQVRVHSGRKGVTQGRLRKQVGTDCRKAMNDPLKRISKESANQGATLRESEKHGHMREEESKRAEGEGLSSEFEVYP